MVSGTDASDPTGQPSDRRRLIVVVHADVVGYSRLIGLDDIGTLDRMRRLRREVVDPTIAAYGGRIVNTGGDALLMVFDSVDGAVRSALRVQQQAPVLDGEVPPDRAIRFRIGINVGDVIPDGTDVHGDVVNVAARLQAECSPGGICVSRAVRDHMQGRLDVAFEALGSLNLKNIAHPVEAFMLSLATTVGTLQSVERLLVHGAGTLPLPDKPSIAVLPFANLSADPDQEYFSDGVADDIITELSRSRSLFVIARNSSFTYKGRAVDVRRVAGELGVRYVLEGSVRRGGERVRVNAQLIDAETGNHIWADRYDRDLADVFAVQDDITLAVARAIGPAVTQAEQLRTLRKSPGNLGAWEAYQRGMWHLLRFRSEDIPRAREFFNYALELDPTLAIAHTGLAIAFNREGTEHSSRPLLEALRLYGDEAQKALELDPTDAEAHVVRASAVGSFGDYSAGFDHVERALSINPNCAMAYHFKGWLQIITGRPAEGRDAILRSIRLDPRRAFYPYSRNQIAMSYDLECDYETTVAEATRLIADRPDFPHAYRWLAAALGELARGDEARAALDKAIETGPDEFRLYVEQRVPSMRQIDYDHMLDGLRKAGWPA
jgi:adenylate cyclase